MQTAGILPIRYDVLLNVIGAYTGQHIAIFQENFIMTYRELMVTLEDKFTLSIAHMNCTFTVTNTFAKRQRVVYSIKVAGVYMYMHCLMANQICGGMTSVAAT